MKHDIFIIYVPFLLDLSKNTLQMSCSLNPNLCRKLARTEEAIKKDLAKWNRTWSQLTRTSLQLQ